MRLRPNALSAYALALFGGVLCDCFVAPLSAQTLALRARDVQALRGTEVLSRIDPLPFAEREKVIMAQVTSGNVPNFLRKLCPIEVRSSINGRTNTATYFVTPEYLAVGSDEDYFLTPLSPNAAQRVANALGCSLPTRKMVDDIYAAAEVKLTPIPIPPSPAMTTVSVFSNHNAIVRAQRDEQARAHPLGALVAGHKKDVVLSSRLAAAPGKVAIYGWHNTNGLPIQPLYLGHTSAWVDYSQCIRLVQQKMIVNDKSRTVAELLHDPTLAKLISDEGVIEMPAYPTNWLGATDAPLQPSLTNLDLAALFSLAEPGPFGESTASFELEPEFRLTINLPAQETFTSGKKALLIFYALPNGNTTGQTIGKTLRPGDDWHYDIQHIGAQTRFLRRRVSDQAIATVYLENDLKSWPAWRKKHGDQSIPGIIDQVKKIFQAHDPAVILTGHSGGGSLIFGYLNALEAIPNDVARIAFLDSNYAYDRGLGHLDKLTRWLRSDRSHYFCVLAYDDAAALLDGKSFVSAAGGTWGKSHEMLRDLEGGFKFMSQTNGGLQKFSALDGRIQIILKENPERKILHTVQVERNGFIHAMVSGTSNENSGYEYFGPRAYTNWIQAAGP